MFVVGVEFLANHPTFIKAAMRAKAMGAIDSATMRAIGAGGQNGFPAGAAMSLIGMSNTLLGNWHGVKSSIFNKV
jgi:hypothetical protein